MNENNLPTLLRPLDGTLAKLLGQEYLSLQRRFLLRDWEPATLDGGQFAEISARCLYSLDSGTVNMQKGVHECLSYVEDDSRPHHLSPRKDALNLARATSWVYKLRSSRGAVHISPGYSANEMDATVISEVARWVMAEFVRVLGSHHVDAATRKIRDLLRLRLPAVYRGGLVPVVQYPDLPIATEVALLLRDADASGHTVQQLTAMIPRNPRSVSRAVGLLIEARQVTAGAGKAFVLTDRGRASVDQVIIPQLNVESPRKRRVRRQ